MSTIPPLRVDVDLGERSYPIHIAPGLFGEDGSGPALIKEHVGSGRVLIIADEKVGQLYGETFVRSLARVGVEGVVYHFPRGEENKSLKTAEHLWKGCAEKKIDRTGTIIALGGGVTGDLAGFVAACWMRGVNFIQVPTTLLAMVDSSVGGKTGVNSVAGKNLIGAFKQPACVLIDPTLLTTMDPREYRAGLAEVLKYGVIRDPAFFTWQEAHADQLADRDPIAIARAVAECCRIKAWYVQEDETEQGVRAELNYGHTFGHALERETAYATYLHGEAVGIGMRMAADLARRLGVLRDDRLATRQDALLERYRLPLVHRCADREAAARRLAAHCQLDKKVAGGRTRFILPTGIGQVTLREAPDPAQVEAAFISAIA